MKQFIIIYALLTIAMFSSCTKDEDGNGQLPLPEISSASPLEGRPGTIVTIRGGNFSRTRLENKVEFNGVEANIIHFNENTIHVHAPEGSTDGPIVVTVAGQSAQGPTFEFIQPPPPTGETVVVKIISMGIQPFALANASRTQAIMEYLGELAKARDVDFLVAREVDSVTTRSASVDRPLVLSQLSELPNYHFARGQAYQNGYFGLTVYSKHPIISQESYSLNDNRVLGLLRVQLTQQSQVAFGGVQMEDVINRQSYRNNQANILINVLNDVMIPTIVAGNIFLLNQDPTQDETFQIFAEAGYKPGCTSCEWTFPASTTVNSIADFVMYKWAREARVIKYETLDVAPVTGANRRPVYAEIELSL